MTAFHLMNLVAAIFAIAALAGGRLDRRPSHLAQSDLVPLFAEPGSGSLARGEDAAA